MKTVQLLDFLKDIYKMEKIIYFLELCDVFWKR